MANGAGNGHWRELLGQVRAWAQIVSVLAVPALFWMASSLSKMEQAQAVTVEIVQELRRVQLDQEKRIRDLEKLR